MLPDLSVVICESTLTTTTPATTKAVKTMPTFESILGFYFSKVSSIWFFQKLFISEKKENISAVLFLAVLTSVCNL